MQNRPRPAGGLRPQVDRAGGRQGRVRIILNGPGRDAIFGAIYDSVADIRAVLASWFALYRSASAVQQRPASHSGMARRAPQWIDSMEHRFATGGAGPGITWQGRELKKLGIVVNSALAVGGDPLKLAARLIAQADDHCWA